MNDNIELLQSNICTKYGAKFFYCDPTSKVGISSSLKGGARPIHGMRVEPDVGTSGWFIWTGDYSSDADFFLPLHAAHLSEWESLVLPYLGLPPGWRFLIAENYEDVWWDPNLVSPYNF
jgi:hypothetical protein